MAQFTGALEDVKSQWFAAQGYVSNNLQEQEKAYLSAQVGVTQTSMSLRDLWEAFLKLKGQVGNSVKDMYVAELIKSKAGSTSMSVSDLEYKFYDDSTNTFA
jgi:hypothetical protein